MTLVIPHNIEVREHTSVPGMWRARCSCGWWALTHSRADGLAAGNSHLSAEEPFPNWLTEEGEPSQ